jgi:hypothetical protein
LGCGTIFVATVGGGKINRRPLRADPFSALRTETQQFLRLQKPLP